MSSDNEYRDSSFDDFLSEAVKDGTLDYLEERSTLLLKLQELDANSPASTKHRVARAKETIRAKETKTKVEEGPSWKNSPAQRLQAIEETLKNLERTLVRVEGTLEDIKSSIKELEETNRKGVPINNINENNRRGVSTHPLTLRLVQDVLLIRNSIKITFATSDTSA